MNEARARVARDVCDDLIVTIDAQRALEIRQADLILELICWYDRVPDAVAAGAERLSPAGSDGTPLIAEFLVLELAPLIGASEASAQGLIRDVADLAHRLPKLWGRLHDGAIPLWQARKIAQACGDLSEAAAGVVDSKLAPALGRLPWGRLLRRVLGLVAQADTDLAARRAAARNERGVWIRHHADFSSTLFARLNTAQARQLAHAVDTLAREAAARPGCESSADELRANALATLAAPTGLSTEPIAGTHRDLLDPTAHPPASAATTAAPVTHRRRSVAGGQSAGAEAAPTDASHSELGAIGIARPKSTMVIHLQAADLSSVGRRAGASGSGTGFVADRGRLGPLLEEQVRELVAHDRVTIRPVIDLNSDPAVDSRPVPSFIRRHLLLRELVSVFPFAIQDAIGCDLDHTVPYDPGGPPGQTRPSNLGPLGRRTHRSKTHGGWTLSQPQAGAYRWRSSLGYVHRVDAAGSARIDEGAAPDLPQPP